MKLNGSGKISFNLRLWLGVVAIWLATFSLPAQAYDTVILVANSSHFSLLHRIETAIYTKSKPRPQLVRIEAEELIDSTQFDTGCENPCRLIVAVGSKATKAVLETRPNNAVLSILIRKHAYEDLVKAYQKEHGHPPNITAIYLDQSFNRQFHLINSVINNDNPNTNIGVLLGPNSASFEPKLEKAAKNHPFNLQIITVKNQDNAIAALDVLLEDVQVILALPDNTIYNSRTARGLLLSAYRKHVPIIGFSRTYVNNGALAAVHSSPKQIASQTAQVIDQIINDPDKRLPPPQFPNDFTVAVNHQVSRSLSLDVDSEQNLYDKIFLNEKLQGERRLGHDQASNVLALSDSRSLPSE